MLALRERVRSLLLRTLGLGDAQAAAADAHRACVLAQRAAAQALSFAQAARDAADLAGSGRAGGPATGGRGGLEEDIDVTPYPR